MSTLTPSVVALVLLATAPTLRPRRTGVRGGHGLFELPR
jgi:hypothetical protein